jgi:hypothetical protein
MEQRSVVLLGVAHAGLALLGGLVFVLLFVSFSSARCLAAAPAPRKDHKILQRHVQMLISRVSPPR